MRERKEYPSRVDWWIAALVIGSVIFCLGLGIYLLWVDRIAAFILFGITLVMVVVTLLLAIPCRYILYDDHLLVQSGVIKYTIPYSDIRKIEKSSNPLSSPAMSLRRIKITRSKGFILISPPDRDQFIQELQARLG